MGFPTRIAKTASQNITGSGGFVEAVLISNTGADTVIVALYDGGATGVQRASFYVPPSANPSTVPFFFPKEGMEFENAIYVTVEGAAPDVTIVVG